MPTNSEENKTQTMKLYAPAVALKFINEKLNISDLQLAESYGVSRTTLSRIKNGVKLTRSYHYYLGVFVDVLRDKRLVAERTRNHVMVQHIDYLLRDLILLHFEYLKTADRCLL